MGHKTAHQAMDHFEEQAEDRLKLLHVVNTAPMMRVTRQAILTWIEAECRRDRETFGAPIRDGSPAQMS